MITFLWILLIIFLCCLPPFLYFFRKYVNPYKLYFFFGKKGSGKTTVLAKICWKGLKKGHPVYSTELIPGVIKFDVDIVGKNTFPEESIVTIDEAGMKYDSRDFKSFPKAVRDYFKYQRHEKNTVYLFSQSFDIDKKIRDLTDAMYLCTCHFNFISVARKIKKSFKIVEASSQGESRIADNLEFEPLWLAFFGVPVVMITFIPRWAPLFDSHEKLGLPEYSGVDPVPVPEAAAKMYKFMDDDEPETFLQQMKNFVTSIFSRDMMLPRDPEDPDDPEESSDDDLDVIDL